MKLRRARKGDIKDIDRIYVEGSVNEGKLQFPNVSVKCMMKEMDDAKTKRISGFRRGLNSKNQYWIVAVEKDLVVGFGMAQLKFKQYAVLDKVYVSRRYRRKGVGFKISKELIKWLKSKKMKYIESGAYWNNKPSIKLHEKLGFKPISLKMRLK